MCASTPQGYRFKIVPHMIHGGTHQRILHLGTNFDTGTYIVFLGMFRWVIQGNDSQHFPETYSNPYLALAAYQDYRNAEQLSLEYGS